MLGIAGAGAIARDTINALSEQIDATIEAGDRMTISVNRLQSVMGTTRGVAQDTYNTLEQSAEKTGIGVDEMVKSFVGFDLALAGIGQSRSQIVDFTTTLSTLAHVSGTTGAAANRAFRELSEGLATGAVNLRQLKIAGQDMPPLLAALAASLGVTVGQLEQMASAGKLTTDVVATAVAGMAGKVQAAFGTLPVSLATARQDLATAADQLRAVVDQKLGFSQFLSGWDQGLANFLQRIANGMDTGLTASLAKAKADLAQLKALAASGAGASVIGQFADPTASTSLSTQALQQRIDASQKLVTALQAEADKQSATDAAAAASALKQHQLAEATEAVNKAMEALGLAHDKTAPEIQTLSDALARGQDVTVSYDGAVLHASQVLDLLRAKATPAAQAIAALNEELVKANAANLGGAQAKLTETLLKADPADPTGQGRNLSPDRIAGYRAQVDALLTTTGQKEVDDATNRLKLAQAGARGRAANDHGLAESQERIRQARAKFLADHGNSPQATAEADQITSADTTAAQLAAQAASVKSAQPGINVLTDLKAKVAEATAAIHGNGTAVAEWTAKLATAPASVKAQGAAILDYAAQLDVATAAQKRAEASAEALKGLQGNLAKAQEDATTAQSEASGGGRSALQRQIDDFQRQQDHLVRTAQADTSNPDRGIQASQDAAQATATEALALITQQVNANATATLTIRKSWDDTYTGRRTAALAEVQQEGQALDQSIALYVTNADQKKKLTDQTTAYIAAKTEEAMRQTEGQTAKLGRSWSDTAEQMDAATASFASSFVDTLADSLSSGKASWADFANSVIKQLDKIAIQAALSPLLKLAGAGTGSTGGIGGLLTSAAGYLFGGSTTSTATATITPGLSPVAPSVYVPGNHAGGIVGLEATFMRSIPASVFANAPRFHTGGIAGDEVPTILQKGEGVFTAGQMDALGMQGNAVAALSQAVASMSAAQLAPPPDISTPANFNYNVSTPANVGTGTSSTGAGSAAPQVLVNFHNQTGTPQTATASQPRFDGEKMIVDIITKHVNQPGALRTAIKS